MFRRLLSGFAVTVGLAAILMALFPQAGAAGPLRNRKLFNERANGFWMKGRCFYPGRTQVDAEWNVWNSILPGSYNAAKFGCLVKNRKGKRRAGKRKAHVTITVRAVFEGRDGLLRTEVVAQDDCSRARRCRVRTSRIAPSSGPDPRVGGTVDTNVVGMLATICAQRVGWKKKKFKKPTGGPEDQRLDWCLNWGTECGSDAADAFCRRQGFDRAVKFSKDSDVGTTTWVPGAERRCRGDRRHCDSFKKIKCGERRNATQFDVHMGRTPARVGTGVRDKRRDLAECR